MKEYKNLLHNFLNREIYIYSDEWEPKIKVVTWETYVCSPFRETLKGVSYYTFLTEADQLAPLFHRSVGNGQTIPIPEEEAPKALRAIALLY